MVILVMTPAKDSMSPSELDRRDNVVGGQNWNLEKQGFLVAAHDTAEALARDVLERASVD